jgi:hypothetical protein
MPLKRGTSENIKELITNRYPQQQAVAIALSKKRESKKTRKK